MAKASILIVEDDQDLREALVTTLEMARYRVREADSGEQALQRLSQRGIDMVISDVNMPGMSGHDLLAEIQRQYPGIPVMLMTAYGQISQAVAAMQAGAVDYLVKPFEPQVLIDAVQKFVGTEQAPGDEPVAEDPASQRMFQLARKVAAADTTVMILGESGTGKEVLARYIHQHSPRSSEPFIAINCAAIPENMLEAILFGHEKGAYTGAYTSAPGKFEQANGGTLLLDEISEMALGLQAKLLRVLQEREVERVGGRKSISLDVRVLATSNRDLREAVRDHRFREDLYYRLSVFPLQWKPLRERPGDIVPLAEYLLRKHASKMKLGTITLEDSAKRVLAGYAWPGNVRELDNAIQRALVLHQGQRITAEDLSLDPSMAIDLVSSQEHRLPQTQDEPNETGTEADEPSLGRDLRQREFQIIIETLRSERGRRKQAAERLGISPRTLRYKLAQMRELGIDLEDELALA